MATASCVMNSAARSHYRKELMQHAAGLPNDGIYASMIASWMGGEGALPAWMGLDESHYRALLREHFPTLKGEQWQRRLELLDAERLPEAHELLSLLLRYRRGESVSEAWMAQIVVAGCMGSDHLWQDLGLWSRDELSALIAYNFPELKRRNDRDMKWKKFLYKQLCNEEGIYTCRAPSCEVCADYDNCFGPEA